MGQPRSRIQLQLGNHKVTLSRDAARRSVALERVVNDPSSSHSLDLSRLDGALTREGLDNAQRFLTYQPLVLNKKSAFETLVAAAILEIPSLINTLKTSVYAHTPHFSVTLGRVGKDEEVNWNTSTPPLIKATKSFYVFPELAGEESRDPAPALLPPVHKAPLEEETHLVSQYGYQALLAA